ncbi:hypothetical protein FQR65_LT04573 [Abscondita terminalis]|nr:hypothetical protein FQR65_LT04573 [Abscondita terminalis]
MGNCEVDNITGTQWFTPYVNALVNDNEKNIFAELKTKNVVEVTVDDTPYINVRLDRKILIIYPSKNFENFELNEKNTNDPNIIANLSLNVFYQPIRDLNTYKPKFSKKSYTFNLPMPLPPGFNTTKFGEEIVACDEDISNLRLSFSLILSKDLTVEWQQTVDKNLKCHRAVLKVMRWVRFPYDQNFQILATDEGVPQNNGRADLFIKISENCTLPFLPMFEFPYYKARYVYTNVNYYFYIHVPIKLVYSNSNACVRVSKNYKKYFSIQLFYDLVTVSVIEKFDEDVLINNSVIFVTLEVYMEDVNKTETTVLEIYLHKQVTGTAPGIPHLEFEQNNYWFEITSWYYGVVGHVKARTNPFLEIHYSLGCSNDFPLPNQLTINSLTGRISLTHPLNTGIYNFIVVAKESVHNQEAFVNVVINVERETPKLQTQNSVMVVHVKEHEAATVKLPCQYDFALCIYEVIDQHPFTNPCASSLGNLNVAALDRENDQIVNMNVPQFVIQLRIVELAYVRRKRALEPREWINVPKIVHHEVDHLILSVIIDDDNDHPPAFDEDTLTTIGYFHSNSYLPFYIPVTQIKAIDMDSGINADITYTIDNDDFIIHSKTGMLYPRTKYFQNPVLVKISIKAADKNGTGLCSELNLTVVPLQLENLLLLTTNNDSKSFLKDLSVRTNLSIQQLSPWFYAQDQMNTTIVVYGLDGNVPLNSVELERQVQILKPNDRLKMVPNVFVFLETA